MLPINNIRAAFDGVVTQRNIDPGTLVGKGSTPLLVLENLNKLRVRVAVPETYTSAISESMSINFTVDAQPNLIKNAFFHNIKEGHVDIKITATSFEIKNSSDLPEIPKAKLYQRFSRQSAKKDSWGLGLAIAKRICDSSGWSLEYSFGGNEHCFKILFVSEHGA